MLAGVLIGRPCTEPVTEGVDKLLVGVLVQWFRLSTSAFWWESQWKNLAMAFL